MRVLIQGDLVPRRVVRNIKNPFWGKLGPNWEEPYRVTLVVGMAAYRLEYLDGIIVPRPWNVNNLHKYYL